MYRLHEKYEAVIGLEIHIQLLTNSKAYSNDLNEYGDEPNSNISAITLAHPGVLPKVNEKQLQFAVLLGLACECDLREENQYARKNYFYADMPKGYQTTQDETPICTNGFVRLKDADGKEKKVSLTRIHMEEDSGKSIHDQDPFNTLIDLNRAGTPLLEMVTEPDIRSSEEAYNFVTEVRKLVRYLEICDGNMEEGSMRCDANISVRERGAAKYGTKVEVKNMNSMRNVQRAIEYEIDRQIEAVENGEEIFHETRSFDAATGSTAGMRSKEDANDYRYFPEPDLLPIYLTQEKIDGVKEIMPPLPHELYNKYTNELKLSDYDAQILTDIKDVALYYEKMIALSSNYKVCANWLMGEVKGYLNEKGLHISEFPISAERLVGLIQLIEEGKVSNSIAGQKVFPALLENGNKTAAQIADEQGLVQEDDSDALMGYIKAAIEAYPEKAADYKGGKKGLLGLFMGEVMKRSGGKADPKKTNALLREELEK
ncbi:Asp-tRNA(Asn)/Glu-tRNA(Gln) amidotransferase subunit GatB [Salibacteraceae bacterium]|nr:Asp-tRNA(Asn)/Glu-tRNA(Gln) amidotransferase subunit GatB [Salibacteraceae bacterium]